MSALTVDLVTPRPGFEVTTAFHLPPGQVLAIVGPNGAGKSTLLAAIAGLIPASGSVRLGDREVHGMPAQRRGVGLVFQDLLLFPHLTVRDNVAFAARVRGRGWREPRAAASDWLERFDLVSLADRRPGELSGGQAQRVALARALAADPEVLLLDEPLASLDVEIRDEVRSRLAGYVRSFGGASLVVTHDRADVEALADSVAVLEAGRLVQRGSLADLAAAPATGWIARFVGSA